MARLSLLALLPAICASFPDVASAAALRATLDADVITLDEYVEVTIQANGNHARLVVPTTDEFEIENATDEFEQPIFCMAMGTTIMSGPCVFKFHFRPQKAGKLTIPAFKLVDDFWAPGRVLGETRPAEITVSEGTGGARKKTARPKSRGGGRSRNLGNRLGQPQEQGGGSLKSFGQTKEAFPPGRLKDLEQFAEYDLFLLPALEHDSVTLNQPFRVDYVLYVGDQSGASQLQGLELPELDGFRKEQVEVTGGKESEAAIRGRHYSTFILASYILIPMEAGQRTLAAAEATVLASVTSFQQSSHGFSVSFRSGSQPVPVFSPPVLLEVKAAPAPSPDGFDHANVGRFHLGGLSVPEAQPAGSWVVLKYEIEGAGNLLAVRPPSVSTGGAVERREPYVDTSNVVVDETGIHGRVGVQLPMRFEKAGEYALAPLKLVYFDPETGRFGESTLELPGIMALAPKEAEGSASVQPAEIEGIIADAELTSPAAPQLSVPPLAVASYAGGVPALFGLLLFGRWTLRRAGSDPRRRRMKRLVTEAHRDLALARKAATGESADRFYSLLSKALCGYVEGRFSISVGSTLLPQVSRLLVERGLPEDLAGRVCAEIESAEFGRFAPTRLQEGDRREACRRAAELLARLDRVKVKERSNGK